jgi:Spy/CpxP family protein refolding chaperone
MVIGNKALGSPVGFPVLRRDYALWGAMALSLGVTACSAHTSQRARNDRVYQRVSDRVEDVLEDIEASDQQRARIHDVKDRVFVDLLALRDSLRKVPRAALGELKKDEPNPDELHALIDKRVDELRATMHRTADNLLEAHATLSPEQRGQIVARIEERMGRYAEE